MCLFLLTADTPSAANSDLFTAKQKGPQELLVVVLLPFLSVINRVMNGSVLTTAQRKTSDLQKLHTRETFLLLGGENRQVSIFQCQLPNLLCAQQLILGSTGGKAITCLSMQPLEDVL